MFGAAAQGSTNLLLVLVMLMFFRYIFTCCAIGSYVPVTGAALLLAAPGRYAAARAAPGGSWRLWVAPPPLVFQFVDQEHQFLFCMLL